MGKRAASGAKGPSSRQEARAAEVLARVQAQQEVKEKEHTLDHAYHFFVADVQCRCVFHVLCSVCFNSVFSVGPLSSKSLRILVACGAAGRPFEDEAFERDLIDIIVELYRCPAKMARTKRFRELLRIFGCFALFEVVRSI